MMKRDIVESWFLLFSFERILHQLDFNRLHSIVRDTPVSQRRNELSRVTGLCRAADLACVFYFRPVLCLQRSAATAILLRRRGFHAELVIGAQLFPFRSHAWVEIEEQVVNDKPYMPEVFQVLKRC